MNKVLALVLLAAGIVLIIFGINANNSASSDVSRFFTGGPTNKALWLLVGGIVSTVAGVTLMTFRNSNK